MGSSDNRSLDQTIDGWEAIVDNYEQVGEPFTAVFADEALGLINIRTGEWVLDVGAGTGGLSLAAAKLGAEVVGVDFAPAMTRRLHERVLQEGLTNVTPVTMDGQSLDFSDDIFDVVLSVFALIFFPDCHCGLQEIHRVLKPGGRAAIVAWSATERLGFIQIVMGALKSAVPTFQPPTEPPVWLRFGDPEVLERAMKDAGFQQVRVHTLERSWIAPSVEWLARRLPGVSPDLSFIFDALSAAEIEAFGQALVEQFGDRPASLEGEAHIAVGIKSAAPATS